MQIKSIKEIKNIGTFVDFTSGASFRFENITFIYGLNTFGKTTITDIFQSLKYNDSNLISSRKTIPTQLRNQKVILSIEENSLEKDLLFQNNNWGQNTVLRHIEVFGSEFIHRNLFTGLSIERENKENFTDFILWEDGVQIAEEIEKDKKILWEKTRNKNNKLPKFVQWKMDTDINNFLKFSIDSLNKSEIENDLLKLKTEKTKEENRLKKPKDILDIEDLHKVEFSEFKILENLWEINNFLQKDYSNIKEEFLEKLSSHINWKFIKKENAEKWIKYGFENIKNKDGECLFCGQSLANAKDMINFYDKYFDESYSEHILEIETKLEEGLKNVENFYFNLKIKFASQFTVASKYKELILKQSFQDLLISFNNELNTINEDNVNEEKKSLLEIIKEKIEQKNKKPYKKIDEINFGKFENYIESYLATLLNINWYIESLGKEIIDFKEQYKDTTKIQEKIDLLNKTIEDLEYKKVRIDQDEECKAYIHEVEDIDDLNKKIEENRIKLKEDQDHYLQTYFKKIDELFKRFWSHNFTLEKEEDDRWHKPVYSLKVKFHNQEISNEQMKTVFSESDRRALALAIFWAKIELKSEIDKKNTIVVLDDPITSFDDNRTMNFIYFLKDNLAKLSQIIIFTHYNKFLSDYNKFTQEKPKVFKIIKGGKLDNFDLDLFLQSEYNQALGKINRFINGESTINPAIFRSFIDILYRPIFSWITPNSIINELYTKCCTFNHNDFNYEQEEENVRNFAIEMKEKLYSFEYNDNEY